MPSPLGEGAVTSGAVLTPLALGAWCFLSYRILTHIFVALKKQKEGVPIIQAKQDPVVTDVDNKKSSQVNVEDTIETPSAILKSSQVEGSDLGSFTIATHDLVEMICKFLRVEEVRQLHQTSRWFVVPTDHIELQRATEYGYQEQGEGAHKQYLNKLFRSVHIFYERKDRLVEYITRLPGNDLTLDSEMTFRNLKYSDPKSDQTLASLNRSLITFNHKPEVIKLLLLIGVDINGQFDMGYTPLICAVACGNLETAVLLLTHGANPNHVDGSGQSPLSSVKRNLSLLRIISVISRFIPISRRPISM